MINDIALSAKKRFCFALALIAIFYLLIVVWLGVTWYAAQFSLPFHFFNDLSEWKQMDKWGHFFTAFQVSTLTARLFCWTRYMEERKARFRGTCVAFFIVSSVEIFDGFSNQYGFSFYDITANALGCFAFIVQYRLWNKVKVFSKFSVHLTGFAALRPSLLGDGFFQRLLKDYNGQTYWFSFHPNFLKLPSWFCLAVGVSAEGMVRGLDAQSELMHFTPYRKYFVSFDIDLSVIKTHSRFLKSCLLVLNMIKIPAPALELSTQGLRFHPIYF